VGADTVVIPALLEDTFADDDDDVILLDELLLGGEDEDGFPMLFFE